MIIKLVRHGQSEVNAKVIPYGRIGDHLVNLTSLGVSQAYNAGLEIGSDFLKNCLVYRSPYQRARQTCDILLSATEKNRDPKNIKIYEDPRLREVDHGYSDVAAQEEMRATHGWFYYRFEGGESPADCYDRSCTFLESMMRQVNRKLPNNNGVKPNVLLVCHGLMMRCFVTRFLHLTPEQFEDLANPKNCDIITLANKHKFVGAGKKWTIDDIEEKPQMVCGNWGVSGLRFREKTE